MKATRIAPASGDEDRGPLAKGRASRGGQAGGTPPTPFPVSMGFIVKQSQGARSEQKTARPRPLLHEPTPESFLCVLQQLPAARGGRDPWGGIASRGGVGATPRNAARPAKEGATPNPLPGGGGWTPPALLGGGCRGCEASGSGAMRGTLGGRILPPTPPGVPGSQRARPPPPGAEPAGPIPSRSPPSLAGRRPILAGTGATPPAVTWAGPHRGPP